MRHLPSFQAGPKGLAVLHHIEYLILATVVHAIVIYLMIPFATSYTPNSTIPITMWSAIALLLLHYVKLLSGTITKLTHP
jgi:hypothetical protein